ncbi:hypothetical protein NADFUDRAFT_65222 [Nadsonia fulvescens var. elongata DSM 6958]|uniref:Heat shock transcription factor n=1 Tax=Nadsonia fulvescens var. elongata DSM 6958 TaxID=857566 RepID=A0A1E3PML6_9ASCO|nr:hypothetical protein NADFUDRAFT_65222 [Nadsonia fulvescens var. elongata DSM 6958]
MSIELSEQNQHSSTDNLSVNNSNGGTSSKTIQSSFVHKLYSMLNDTTLDHLIKWSPNLDSFIIFPSEEFSKILSQFFKHTNISSFIRQLNMYGFHKVNDNNSANNTTFSASTENALENDHIKEENDNEETASSTNFWEFRHGTGNFKKGDLDSLSLIKRRKSRQYTMNHKISEPIPLRRSVLINPFEGYPPPPTHTAPPSNLHPQFQTHPQIITGLPPVPSASSKMNVSSPRAPDSAINTESLPTGSSTQPANEIHENANVNTAPGSNSVQQQPQISYFSLPHTPSQPANLQSSHGTLPPPNLAYPRSDYPKHSNTISFPVSSSVSNSNGTASIQEYDNIIASLESSVNYLHESHSRLASKNTLHLESLKALYNSFIQMVELIQQLKPDGNESGKEENREDNNDGTRVQPQRNEAKLARVNFEMVNQELFALKSNLEQQSLYILQDDKSYQVPASATSNYFSARYQSSAQEINSPTGGTTNNGSCSSISSQSVYMAPSKFNSLFGAKTSRGRAASAYFDPLAPVSTPTSPSANNMRKDSVCGPPNSVGPVGTTSNPSASIASPSATLKDQSHYFPQTNYLPPPPNHPSQQIPPSSHLQHSATSYSNLPYGSIYSSENTPNLKQSALIANHQIKNKGTGNSEGKIQFSNHGERPGSPSTPISNSSLPTGPPTGLSAGPSTILPSSLISPSVPQNSNFVPRPLSRNKRPVSYPYWHGRSPVNGVSFNGGGIAEAMKFREGVTNGNGNSSSIAGNNQAGSATFSTSENVPFLHPQRRHTSSDVPFASLTCVANTYNQYTANTFASNGHSKSLGSLASMGTANNTEVGTGAGISNTNGLLNSKSSNVLNLLNPDETEEGTALDRKRKRSKTDV